MKTLLLTLFFVLSNSSFAESRPLKDVMAEMGPKLKEVAKATTLDEAARLNADTLKKLSLEASVLAPSQLSLADQVLFEGLLLNIALKANQIESAILANDAAKVAAIVKEIVALKNEGHGKFIPN